MAGKEGQDGKTTLLTVASKEGRIQDLLLLFTTSPQAPMSGIVSFHAKVSVPPGETLFLKKVELQGDFGVDAGTFTKTETQQGLNSLSRGARGEKNPKPEKDDSDPQNVLSNLKGHVLLNNGIATFSRLSFGIPGALAQMRGTYDLISEKIDLHGTLKTEAEVSKTTHGIKALMLKALDPLFKNKPNGYLAPVKITGTYDHPQFGLDLGQGSRYQSECKKACTSSPGPGKAVTIAYRQASGLLHKLPAVIQHHGLIRRFQFAAFPKPLQRKKICAI